MISNNIQSIIDGLARDKSNDIYGEDKGPLISVNALAGRASVFYEKLRYMVDYKEEHTIRRSAIERILKRHIMIEQSRDVGLALLTELVSSGYLQKKEVPETIATKLNNIIRKYSYLGLKADLEDRHIISLMASEIERYLYPQVLDDLVTRSFYETVAPVMKYSGGITDDELRAQTYLGARRSLYDEDAETSFYALLCFYMPTLAKAESEADLKFLEGEFSKKVREVERAIDDPIGWKMAGRLQNHAVCYRVIREVFHEYGLAAGEIFADPEKLESTVGQVLEKKYQEQYNLVTKSGMRAIVYILMTKIVLAFLLELPYEQLVLGEVNYLALGTNVVFHPLLLYFMVTTVPYASRENTVYITKGIGQITRGEGLKNIYLKSPVTNFVFLTVFDVFYLVLFTISFGAILYVLHALGFNIVSVVLFLFFLTLVSYLGFRIRFNAKKWKFTVDNDNFWDLLFSFFTVPIIRTGRWLSRKFATVNIFVFVLDFIIETPLKLVLGTFGSFVSFLKEKREDPY